MSTVPNDLILPESQVQRIAAFFQDRPEVMATDPTGVRESTSFLCGEVLGSESLGGAGADLCHIAATVATVARFDMSSAFSLWCQCMVSEYLSHARPDSYLGAEVLSKVQRAEVLGSTAMASAMAHYVSGSPIPIVAERVSGKLILNGRVLWASNLYPPGFIMVTAATDSESGRPLLVAIPGDAPGLCIEPYPHLLALQGTGSSSLVLSGVEVSEEWVVTDEFEPFIERVRPPFLLLQCSFAYGLAQRSLEEASPCLQGVKDAMRCDLEELEAESSRVAGLLNRTLADRGASISTRDLVRLRLDSARLATNAVALEAKSVGGRAYVVSSPTARRMREAAFLPVQAPTEGQLRWELSRYE